MVLKESSRGLVTLYGGMVRFNKKPSSIAKSYSLQILLDLWAIISDLA